MCVTIQTRWHACNPNYWWFIALHSADTWIQGLSLSLVRLARILSLKIIIAQIKTWVPIRCIIVVIIIIIIGWVVIIVTQTQYAFEMVPSPVRMSISSFTGNIVWLFQFVKSSHWSLGIYHIKITHVVRRRMIWTRAIHHFCWSSTCRNALFLSLSLFISLFVSLALQFVWVCRPGQPLSYTHAYTTLAATKRQKHIN